MDKQLDHFKQIAVKYDIVRTTDSAPVKFASSIIDSLGTKHPLIYDVGCGSGRYTFKILEDVRRALHIIGIDNNPEMLAIFADHCKLNGGYFKNVEARLWSAEHLNTLHGSVDLIMTFNAIHWFDTSSFLASCKRLLTNNGKLLIYTRTQLQNAETVWGQMFPAFTEKENRLFIDNTAVELQMNRAGFQIEKTQVFQFKRESSLSRLLFQVLNKHYSTFELYEEQEFLDSVCVFVDHIINSGHDTRAVRWIDENTMYVITRC